jgi:alkylation response protein AidB-like acyl-CoA dehydrogenase
MTAEATPVAALSLDQFRSEAESFLSSRCQWRTTDGVRTADRYSLFRGSTAAEADAAREWQRAVFDAGFGWITGPTEYGGRGLSARHERLYQSVERQFEIPGRAALGVSLGMVAPTLMEFGTAAAKSRWAKAIHRGDIIGCQLFSEPGAGSDLAAVATRATRTGDEWVVDGQKVWTSGAHYSELGLLLARSSDDGRHRNLTAFLVDMASPGVEVRPLRQMTGGADFNEVFLTDVRVPDRYRLGQVGEGWQVAVTTLMYERGAIGGAVGGGSGLFRMDALARWLRARGCAGDPLVRQAYARVHAGVTAAKIMRERAEAGRRAGRPPGPEMSLAKLALVANLAELENAVSTALGPELVVDTGSSESFEWAEFVLGLPGMRLGGGTDEIQRNIIARRVLGLPAS